MHRQDWLYIYRWTIWSSNYNLVERNFSRVLRVTWTARRSNQSILKEISPGVSLEGMMLKLKLQYFGHLMRRVDSLEKTHAGRDWGQEEKGITEDEMAGWHHQLDAHEFGWTPGVDDGQGGLACCDSWGRKESDTTEGLNWTELNKWFEKEDTTTIRVDGNCSSDVLEKQEGVGKESRVHMEDLVPKSFHHTIQEWCLQNAYYTDGSLTSSKNVNS